MTRARWSERPTADGSWTLWNEELDEGCHSSAGAWTQARQRYARACRLEQLTGPRARVLDVGTGLGLNLAAALEALAPRGVGLEAVTFEREPEVVERGLALYSRAELVAGPWERWHAPIRRALAAALATPGEAQTFEDPRGLPHTLTLQLGDARTTLARTAAAPRADAIFLDPFSPRRCPTLWEEDFLARLAQQLAPEGWLSTYSAAFRVRLALARAGLRVGLGPRVGTKSEGTLASPGLTPPSLPARLARRLARRGGPRAPLFAVSVARAERGGRLECEAWGHAHRLPRVPANPAAGATPS
jgi:tRNA U34 5-methylaminomethyl-2-thiouridine-forming methyltransferase MnmC